MREMVTRTGRKKIKVQTRSHVVANSLGTLRYSSALNPFHFAFRPIDDQRSQFLPHQHNASIESAFPSITRHDLDSTISVGYSQPCCHAVPSSRSVCFRTPGILCARWKLGLRWPCQFGLQDSRSLLSQYRYRSGPSPPRLSYVCFGEPSRADGPQFGQLSVCSTGPEHTAVDLLATRHSEDERATVKIFGIQLPRRTRVSAVNVFFEPRKKFC